MGVDHLLSPDATASAPYPVTERLLNVFFGLNVLSWGILGLVFAPAADRWTCFRIVITVFHFTVGFLFLARRRCLRHGQYQELLLSLPSFVAGGVVVRLAAAPSVWPWYADAAVVTGALLALAALLTLGRSFAILPAFRGLVSKGPYRCIRHPAYLGELIMLAACLIAAPGWAVASAALAAAALIILRIVVEERVLRREPSYAEYAATVRWRLLPQIW